MSHVYELRMYTANPGKLDAVVARFRDHAEAIFPRYNLKSVGCWIPQDNSKNLFIYIVEHESRAAAEKNWEAFRNDADWKRVKAASETDGPLVGSIERYFMDPTAFSALK
jgi:hypothetical protein